MQKLTWPAVGLIAVLGGIALALATLAHWDAAAILGILGILGGIGGGAAVAGGVVGRVEQLQEETSAQSSTLATIDRRVNGELDGRIATAVQKGNADLLAELQRRGVIR